MKYTNFICIIAKKTLSLQSIMTFTTSAIVLALHKKGDNTTFLEAYTRYAGRATFLVYGNRWKSVLQPMALVELSVQQAPNREIGTLNSAELNFVPQHHDMPHQCMALFMAETLAQTMRHPMADEELFRWIEEKIKQLDRLDELADFPNSFLTGLSQSLGYGGTILDEWHHLKSLDIIQTIL